MGVFESNTKLAKMIHFKLVLSFIQPYTVKSSMFMVDECLWILLVTLTHKFMSPRVFNKVMTSTATNQ